MLEDEHDFEEQNRMQDRAERQHLAAMDDLGLEGDEALQYALMLSMEEGGGGGGDGGGVRGDRHEGDLDSSFEDYDAYDAYDEIEYNR